MIFLKEENKIELKNKIKNFVIAFLLLIVTYLVIIYISESDRTFDKNLPVSNMQNTQEGIINELLKEEYVIQNIAEEEDGYEINIYYPFTKDDTLNKHIKTRLELYIKDIKFQASKYDSEVQKEKYKLDITFDVTSGNNGYISYIFTVIQDVKFMHPNEYIFVINYDKNSSKVITQEDIEKMYPNLYYNLSQYTYNELLKNEEIKNMGALGLLEEGTKANKYNFMDIAFKENSMVVMFEKYQVAPYVLGTFEVDVPLEYLQNN